MNLENLEHLLSCCFVRDVTLFSQDELAGIKVNGLLKNDGFPVATRPFHLQLARGTLNGFSSGDTSSTCQRAPFDFLKSLAGGFFILHGHGRCPLVAHFEPIVRQPFG